MKISLLKSVVALLIVFSFQIRDSAYSDPNSYKCSIGEYHDCISDSSCWGAAACGRSPVSEGLMPICPTGYHCFCDPDNPACQCVECTSGCSDPYGYFTNPIPACPSPTCIENGKDCLPWGDSGCSVFNSMDYSCTWYNEACCTSLDPHYICSGDCFYPYRMMDFIYANIDPNDEGTWCPSGWERAGGAGFDKVCLEIDDSGNPIRGTACCKSTQSCPGECSTTCPPTGRPELDGVSLVYTCSTGLCCIENVVEPPEVRVPRPREMIYTGPVIESLEEILGPVTKMLYYGGLAIGVFFIILAGYKLMVSEGDPQRTKAAQEQLTTAIIGIIFILLSITILRVIINQIIGEGI